MKYRIATLIAAAIALCACADPLYNPAGDYQSMNEWVNATIEPVDDIAGHDEWQDGPETIERGAGDCEDHAGLLLYMIYLTYGIKGDFVVYMTPTGLHAVALIDGIYYDPVWATMCENLEDLADFEYYDYTLTYDELRWAMHIKEASECQK